MRVTWWFSAIAIVVSAGCGGTVPGASTTDSPPAAATPEPSSAVATRDATTVDVCALVPLGDVTSRSPFSAPLTRSEQTFKGTPTSCHYAPAAASKSNAGIVIEAITLDSADAAMHALANRRQDFVDRGSSPQALSGLGDAAFAVPNDDESAVIAVVGQRLVNANLRGEWEIGDFANVGGAQKVAAGTAMLKQLITRLP